MKDKLVLFDRVKRIVAASGVTAKVDDIYRSEGAGVRVERSPNSVSLIININPSKYTIKNIIDSKTVDLYRWLPQYLKEKYGVDASSLSKKDKKLLEKLQRELYAEYDKLDLSSYDRQEVDEASIEYSKILSSLLNSFLIEEVEKAKQRFNSYSTVVDEKVQEFVNSLRDEADES